MKTRSEKPVADATESTAAQPLNNFDKNDKLINISKKTFISVLIMLFALLVASIVMTYVLPKGHFALDSSGKEDYTKYVSDGNGGGINIFKGIFAPFLNLATGDGLTVIFLSLFLVVISGAFQIMNDVNGIRSLVNTIVVKFKKTKWLLLSLISLAFMAFGSFLGLFEEMLTMLPIIAILAVSLGFDSFTGFLISIVACGFGFASAITNPFTVILASEIIGVNPMVNIWYRIIIFVVMYALLMLAVFLYVKRIEKRPDRSLTFERDNALRGKIFDAEIIDNERKIRITYTVFFAVILLATVCFSAIGFLRDFTVPALVVVFLFGGFICGFIASKNNCKLVFKSFLKGLLSALPSVAFIMLAASIKYVLTEGNVWATIANYINGAVADKNPLAVAFILYAIVLVLEFFVSSSSAKAMVVMAILGVLTLNITKETSVLVYTFADGYTNLLFPTSPVLLIGLSMIGVSYFKWLKKSAPLFIATTILVVGFIAIAVAIGY